MQDYSPQIFTLVNYMVRKQFLTTYPNLNCVLDDGRAVPAKFPCLNMSVTNDSPIAESCENTENGSSIDFTIDCYMTGNRSQNICKAILAYVTDLMRSQGFIVRMKPIKAATSDPNITRYTTRFHRNISGSL